MQHGIAHARSEIGIAALLRRRGGSRCELSPEPISILGTGSIMNDAPTVDADLRGIVPYLLQEAKRPLVALYQVPPKHLLTRREMF